MALKEYRRKRSFGSTTEPIGKSIVSRPTDRLHFVVQKHAATQLHYDFRLELDGVLKSWAVPKGPPLSREDRRLAIMTEDHPLDYAQFKGVIPAGNYGAGTVNIWDYGEYSATAGKTRIQKAALHSGLTSGHLSFILHGRKLKGQFALIKLKRDNGNAWLFIKKQRR